MDVKLSPDPICEVEFKVRKTDGDESILLCWEADKSFPKKGV
jgi:hypothetical protein